MAELLIELMSEEIPPSMQRAAARRLLEALDRHLAKRGFETPTVSGRAKDGIAFSTPRRIGAAMTLPQKTVKGGTAERRGPSVKAGQRALKGFVKSLEKKARVVKRETEKGVYYYAISKMPPLKLETALAEILPSIVENFSWPSSMRWPQSSLSWVRPLRGILCLVDGKPVSLEVGGLRSDIFAQGHAVMAQKPFRPDSFADYKRKMRQAFVIIAHEEREARILKEAGKLTDKHQLQEIDDPELLQESAGLAEWPTVLLGELDKSFMALGEAIVSEVLKTHQKCFALRGRQGKPAPYFLIVADGRFKQGGKAIIAGNERVARARLEDALFFIKRDRQKGLKTLAGGLEKIAFHDRLGSMKDKARRLEKLTQSETLQKAASGEYPRSVLALSARYAKADLASEMVADQPRLQGVMGGIYWESGKKSGGAGGGGDREVGRAIAEHYRPTAAEGILPRSQAGALLALCDRMDALAGFFSIGEMPTGSKDPYALRRAARAILRIALESRAMVKLFPYGIHLRDLFAEALEPFRGSEELLRQDFPIFMAARLQEYLTHHGMPQDIVSAVMETAIARTTLNPVPIRAHVSALESFVKTKKGKDLLVAYKRVAGILAEERKGAEGGARHSESDLSHLPRDVRKLIALPYAQSGFKAALLERPEERELAKYLIKPRVKLLQERLARHEIGEALEFLGSLRAPVDDFFNHVLVHDPDPRIRENRIRLLANLRDAMNEIADFSMIQERE